MANAEDIDVLGDLADDYSSGSSDGSEGYMPNKEDRESKEESNLLVKFFYKKRPDKRYEGSGPRPLVDVEYVEIMVSGSRDPFVAPATEKHRKRFPRHYRAFKQRMELPQEGTPIEETDVASEREIDALSFMKIRTVEQLANMSDANAGNVDGGTRLKRLAVLYLEGNTKDNRELEKEIIARDNTISEMEARLNKLEELLEQQTAPKEVKSKKG